MNITRTANAGILLELDGTRILLDGVCGQVLSYLTTPDNIRAQLTRRPPDAVAVTHRHSDHCDARFESDYTAATGRPVWGPHEAGKRLSCGPVSILAVESRHIGKADCPHVSYLVQGSQCVWFLGDAAPSQWKNRQALPKPDVLVVPYAYATTPSAWRITCSLGAKTVILLHLPPREADSYGLWSAVEQTVGDRPEIALYIPQMGDRVTIE